MSFLALIPTKDKLYALAIVLLLVGGLWYHHKLIAEGIAEQKAADVREATKERNVLQAKATMAEQAYDKEQLANANYRASLPIDPIRLCVTRLQSPVGAAKPGNENTGAAAASVQPMPSGDPGSGTGAPGPDISGMLRAFGSAADQVSATLREYQHRE